MKIIEPCCAQRHLRELRDSLGRNGEKEFTAYGDVALTELLPALLTRYCETEMLIAAPAFPDQAADIIGVWLRRRRARMDGQGTMPYVRRLTLVGDLSPEASPTVSGWLQDNPFGEQLVLVHREQKETAILLPDFAIIGPVNMRYSERFTATATVKSERIAALWSAFSAPTDAQKESAPQEKPAKRSKKAAGMAKKRS